MSKTYHLTTPLSDETVSSLNSGDIVYISGIIYTARDAAHKKLVDLLDDGKELPFEINGAIIYFVGPTKYITAPLISKGGSLPSSSKSTNLL